MGSFEAMPEQNLYHYHLMQYIGTPFILGFKLSLRISYLRIIPGRRWRSTIIAATAACTLYHTSFLLAQLFLCTPVTKQGDKTITSGYCVPPVPFYITMSSLIIAFDIIVYAPLDPAPPDRQEPVPILVSREVSVTTGDGGDVTVGKKNNNESQESMIPHQEQQHQGMKKTEFPYGP
ncbi:hypothetical protein PG993_012831 [Apiospora rasikravindrae]|uniref:Rhodopsin domain-containing protein n=1 Tax=Apiospora rasikravindrae TaxID=990691 RepID=A0ABR1RVW6_9PEZI